MRPLFVHSYNDELYDRARNIPALGFDQIIYQDDFLVDKTYAGGYVSDDTLADELIARFEASGGRPGVSLRPDHGKSPALLRRQV